MPALHFSSLTAPINLFHKEMFSFLLGILSGYDATNKLTLLFGHQHPGTRGHVPEEQRPQLLHCCSPDTSSSALVHCTGFSECREEGDSLCSLTVKINVARFLGTSGHGVASQSCGIFYVERLPHKACGLTFWRRNYFLNFSTPCI